MVGACMNHKTVFQICRWKQFKTLLRVNYRKFRKAVIINNKLYTVEGSKPLNDISEFIIHIILIVTSR